MSSLRNTTPTASAPVATAITDDRVLRAAYDSIMEVGVRRTTLADVARRAGVSRMTVYRKYDDLPSLLSALLTAELGSLLTESMQAAKTLPTSAQRVAYITSQTAAALAAHPVLARVLAVDPEAVLPLIVDRLGTTQRTGLATISGLLADGQAPHGDGSIRDGDTDLMSLTMLASAQSFVFSARSIHTADPLGHAFSELERMLLGYVAADPTRSLAELDSRSS